MIGARVLGASAFLGFALLAKPISGQAECHKKDGCEECAKLDGCSWCQGYYDGSVSKKEGGLGGACLKSCEGAVLGGMTPFGVGIEKLVGGGVELKYWVEAAACGKDLLGNYHPATITATNCADCVAAPALTIGHVPDMKPSWCHFEAHKNGAPEPKVLGGYCSTHSDDCNLMAVTFPAGDVGLEGVGKAVSTGEECAKLPEIPTKVVPDGKDGDGDAKDGDAKDGDAKDGDAKDGDAKDGDAKDGDAKDKDGGGKDGGKDGKDGKEGSGGKDSAMGRWGTATAVLSAAIAGLSLFVSV